MEKQQNKIKNNVKRSQNITITKYRIGQAVRLFAPTKIEGKKAKLLQRWYGPYFIKEIKNQGRVIYLQDSDKVDIKTPVSVNRIDPYPIELIPNEIDLPQSSQGRDQDSQELDSEASITSDSSSDVDSDNNSEDDEQLEPDVVTSEPQEDDEPYIPSVEITPLPPLVPVLRQRFKNVVSRPLNTRYNFKRRFVKKE